MEKSMAFPPEFSSTETYENRYDLDELDVFLEGDSSSPMFFNISGLPENLSFGKHYFNLSILDSTNLEYQLRPNSKILFEIKSTNNVILKSDVVKINQRNGIATCFVEVLKDPLRTFQDIEDGQGTLTIVGSVQHKTYSQNPIPEKFIGAMNYRCKFPIQIRKTLINADAPIVMQTEHKKTSIAGAFSFAKGAVPTSKNSPGGTIYDDDGNSVTNQVTDTDEGTVD